MAYDIRLVKLVTGELVIGKFNAEANALEDVAAMKMIPTQQGGVQMMMLPYGYPFDEEFGATIEARHFLYEYKNTPQDVQDKYLEACSNISLSSGGLDPNPKNGGSGLIL